jgi:hypothetical protein
MNSRTALLFSLLVVASPAASQAAFTAPAQQHTSTRNQILKPLHRERMNQHILATILSSVRRTSPLAMSDDEDVSDSLLKYLGQ